MTKYYATLFSISILLLSSSCTSPETKQNDNLENIEKQTSEHQKERINYLTDLNALSDNGDVNAVIEIPAGTIDKWELNKTTGQLEWQKVNDQPRKVNYIGYPGNYGMIPMTLLPKEKGGDGDPLDILVLGPSVERGSVLQCKIIGVLNLLDRGEQDDKLIAVSIDSPMYGVENMDELNEEFPGVADIVELWFANYKGPGKMQSNGFGDREVATEILELALEEFLASKGKQSAN